MDNYVCVAGGINADIKGISAGLTEDSHQGKIIITGGGVARNVSENLARLSLNVHLFGCVGSDEFGRKVLESASCAGVHTDKVLVSERAGTGIYLSVSDTTGKLKYAVNDMKGALAEINSAYINEHRNFLAGSSLIFADTNLDTIALNMLIEIANSNGIPFFIDTVSASKAERAGELKGITDYLSVNSQEFEILSGLYAGKNGDSGINPETTKNIILRKGAEGALLISGKEIMRVEAEHAGVVEPNGAGDAFNAGFIYALMAGKKKEAALEYGVAASRFALESESSAGSGMNSEKLENRIKSNIK